MSNENKGAQLLESDFSGAFRSRYVYLPAVILLGTMGIVGKMTFPYGWSWFILYEAFTVFAIGWLLLQFVKNKYFLVTFWENGVELFDIVNRGRLYYTWAEVQARKTNASTLRLEFQGTRHFDIEEGVYSNFAEISELCNTKTA